MEDWHCSSFLDAEEGVDIKRNVRDTNARIMSLLHVDEQEFSLKFIEMKLKMKRKVKDEKKGE